MEFLGLFLQATNMKRHLPIYFYDNCDDKRGAEMCQCWARELCARQGYFSSRAKNDCSRRSCIRGCDVWFGWPSCCRSLGTIDHFDCSHSKTHSLVRLNPLSSSTLAHTHTHAQMHTHSKSVCWYSTLTKHTHYLVAVTERWRVMSQCFLKQISAMSTKWRWHFH